MSLPHYVLGSCPHEPLMRQLDLPAGQMVREDTNQGYSQTIVLGTQAINREAGLWLAPADHRP